MASESMVVQLEPLLVSAGMTVLGLAPLVVYPANRKETSAEDEVVAIFKYIAVYTPMHAVDIKNAGRRREQRLDIENKYRQRDKECYCT